MIPFAVSGGVKFSTIRHMRGDTMYFPDREQDDIGINEQGAENAAQSRGENKVFTKRKRGKFSPKRIVVMCVIFAMAVFLGIGLFTNGLSVTSYTIASPKVPPSFDGYTIVQITDLHNRVFGQGQEELISEVEKLKPDIIVLTGDMINRDYFDYQSISDLLAGIRGIAPVYAISGNHELDNQHALSELKEMYAANGVVFLDDAGAVLSSPGGAEDEQIFMYGQKMLTNGEGDFWTDYEHTPHDTSQYNIFLSHFSDKFDEIAPMNYDLVIAGHTHGGIIRLPFIGGLLGTDNEPFPKYDGGVFTQGASTMVSGRGLGDSSFIPRLYNNRELVCITLRHEA